MKINRFNEDLKTKSFSDMDKWSTAPKEKAYTGEKTINYELGAKVNALLNSYGLGIVTVSPGEWLKKSYLLLPDEIDFKEYRVQLGKKMEWDDFLENYEDEHRDIKYYDLSEDEQENIRELYNESGYEVDRHDELEFSVFLPGNIKNINDAAMSDASTYLKLLNDSGLKSVIRGGVDNYLLCEETDETTNFINGKKIKITNKNLSDAVTVSYRLHKDGKIFNEFNSNIGENKTRSLFNDWINLM